MAAEPGSRAPRIRPALPVVRVSNRGEMGVLLAKHGRLLREYARQYLGDACTEDEVEDTVERTVNALLDNDACSHAHGLRAATQQLWRECHRTIHDRETAHDVPVDSRVGLIDAEALRILEKLGPRSREAILRAAAEWTPAQQARADHTSVGTINMRLHRARRRFLELKAQMNAEMGSSAGALLLMGKRFRIHGKRALAAAQRHCVSWSNAVCIEPVSQVAAVAVLAVSGSTPMSAIPVVAHAQHGASSPTTGSSPVAAAPAPIDSQIAASVSARGTESSAVSPANLAPVGNTGPLTTALGKVLAGDATPEETQLITAAAASNYASTHLIVALGIGTTCNCPVLFQSPDGGATWQASPTAAPAGAEQVALPPNYPVDPRIFIGTNVTSAATAFMIPQFGASATPLPGPAGHLALSARFDRGDNRVFIAGQGAVVSVAIDAAAATPTPILAYPQWLVSTADVETPPAADGADVVVLAPQGTVIVGDPAAGKTAATSMFACYEGSSCSKRGVVSDPAIGLAVSPSSLMTAVWTTASVSVSQDGGTTFVPRPVSASGAVIRSIAVGSDRVWAITASPTGATTVSWLSSGAGTWYDATGAADGLSRSLRVIAIPGGPILDFLVGRGLRCTADGGLSWGSRCP